MNIVAQWIGAMPPGFWVGFAYGAAAAALPLLGIMAWNANRRVQEHLRRAIEIGRDEGRTPGPFGVYPPPPPPPKPAAESEGYSDAHYIADLEYEVDRVGALLEDAKKRASSPNADGLHPSFAPTGEVVELDYELCWVVVRLDADIPPAMEVKQRVALQAEAIPSGAQKDGGTTNG
jgi:hypothetical protein